MNNSKYRLKIISNCENVEHTFVILDDTCFPFLQNFKFEANTENPLILCQMDFYPLSLEKYQCFYNEETISQYKNKLEILTNGFTFNTEILLNGQKLEAISFFEIDVSVEPEQVNIKLISNNQKYSIKDLSNFVKEYN